MRMTNLTIRTLEIANSQVGVREAGRNRGLHVDLYIRAAGLDPTRGSFPWCAAFVQFCYREACREMDVAPALKRTASVMKLFTHHVAISSKVPTRGSVFIIDSGKGRGHTGFVELLAPDGNFVSVEGNTNGGGSRDGDGVYRRVRSVAECAYFLDINLL